MKRIEEIEELKEQFISQLKPLKIYLFIWLFCGWHLY